MLEAASKAQCGIAKASALRPVLQASVLALAAALISACASDQSTGPSGRSFVYKVGPGDDPSTIHTKAGIVYKERAADTPADRARPAQPAQTPTQVARND